MEDNLTGSTLTDASRTSAAAGETAVDSSTLSLTELNQYLGKDFKDTATALKALKDTQSFVGKREADIEAGVRARLAADVSTAVPTEEMNALKSQVRSLTEQTFYANNPQYKGYEALIRSMGADPAEVVGNEVFKDIFAKGQVADQVAQTKSVVSSSGRVASNTNATQEAVRVANAGRSGADVADVLARSIREEITGA